MVQERADQPAGRGGPGDAGRLAPESPPGSATGGISRTDGPAGAPGEVPPRRVLARPPGDRYTTRSGQETAGSGTPVPYLGRGALYGSGAAAVVAVAWFVLGGVFDASWGLIVAGVAGGWLIGMWTSYGCWGERGHDPATAPRVLAAGLALATWLVATFGVYLWTRAVLPGSTLPFGERLAQVPFLTYLGGFFGPVELLEIAALVALAWYEAR